MTAEEDTVEGGFGSLSNSGCSVVAVSCDGAFVRVAGAAGFISSLPVTESADVVWTIFWGICIASDAPLRVSDSCWSAHL